MSVYVPVELHHPTSADLYTALVSGRDHDDMTSLYQYRNSLWLESPTQITNTLRHIATNHPELYDCLWYIWCIPLGCTSTQSYHDSISSHLEEIAPTLNWEETANMVADWLVRDVVLPLHTLDAVWYWFRGMSVDLRPLPQEDQMYAIILPLQTRAEECSRDGIVTERVWVAHLPSVWESGVGVYATGDGRPCWRHFYQGIFRDQNVYGRLLQTPEADLWREAASMVAEVTEETSSGQS